VNVLKRCVLLILGALGAPTAATAAAWTLPQGTGQMLFSVTGSTATEAFDSSGGLTSTPRYNKLDADVLVEYGFTDALTGIFQTGLQHVDIAAPVDASRTGLDYTDFGARYRLWQDDGWVLSVQGLLEIPGTTDAANPAAIGYTDVEADLRVLVGKSFMLGTMPAFVDVEFAQRQRGDGAPNEFRADGTFGVQVLPRWLILAQSFNVVSEGAGNPIFGSYDYEKFQLSAVYSLAADWAVQGGAFTTYAGANALQENGLVFGVWHKF
jgi:protein XagA